MARSRESSVVDVIADVIMGALIVLLAAFVIGRYVFGARAFAVLTGSMSPALEVGDVVVDTPVAFEDIKVGDVVTYVINDDLDVATHRVVEVHEADRTLTTKGDANDSSDGTPINYRNVVGVMRFSIPRLGYVLSFLSTMTGKIVSITLILVVVIVFAIAHTLLGSRGDDSEDADEGGHRSSKNAGTSGDPGGPTAWSRGDNSRDDEYDDYPEDTGDYCGDDDYDDLFDDDFLDDDDEDGWYDDEDDEFDDMPPLPRGTAGFIAWGGF